jgi:hypothetical protein
MGPESPKRIWLQACSAGPKLRQYHVETGSTTASHPPCLHHYVVGTCRASDGGGVACPAASSTDAEVVAAMGGGRRFVQRRGMASFDTANDVFEMVQRR